MRGSPAHPPRCQWPCATAAPAGRDQRRWRSLPPCSRPIAGVPLLLTTNLHLGSVHKEADCVRKACVSCAMRLGAFLICNRLPPQQGCREASRPLCGLLLGQGGKRGKKASWHGARESICACMWGCSGDSTITHARAAGAARDGTWRETARGARRHTARDNTRRETTRGARRHAARDGTRRETARGVRRHATRDGTRRETARNVRRHAA